MKNPANRALSLARGKRGGRSPDGKILWRKTAEGSTTNQGMREQTGLHPPMES
jgi:hypothetical protein